MDAAPTAPITAPALPERMFPKLTPAQIARFAAHGHRRPVERGEVLIQTGEPAAFVFVVVAGRLVAVRPLDVPEVLVADFPPGAFTGEASMLSGRRSLVHIRVAAAVGEGSSAISLVHQALHA
jgi:thioredoxin reductase (NADPH)